MTEWEIKKLKAMEMEAEPQRPDERSEKYAWVLIACTSMMLSAIMLVWLIMLL